MKDGEKGRLAPKGKPLLLSVVALFWLGAVLTGAFLLARYSATPGKEAMPPGQWPSGSSVAFDQMHPTLVMFIHPHCPCSRASIGELALLMARCKGQVNTRVFFVQPESMPKNWLDTDTWRDANRIPGVIAQRDDQGREASLFNAQTSGDTALYDTKGRLLFHGGITAARGHSGDNAGRDALQNLIFGAPASITKTPTFGCSLFDCNVTNMP
jgi:hypothetical protein